MILETIRSSFLVLLVSFGLGWPIASRLSCRPVEKILATATLSLIAVFLVGWAIFVLGLPHWVFWALPLAAGIGLVVGRQRLQETLREPEVRTLLIAQVVVTTWCVGWLALIVTYSGGMWFGDWYGHWHRTLFFLERGSPDIIFYGFDPLTSRPPLANVMFGAFLAITRVDFAHYQLTSTLLGTLSFAPAAIFASRIGGRTSVAVLTLLVMVSPTFVQNATFAWTKLHAAFFVLAALVFFLRVRSPDFPRAGILFSLALAGALLAHYSAGPYAVVFALAWLIGGRREWRDPAWWRQTATAALAGLALLATWFGWTLSILGVRGTFLTNTSITDQAPTASAQALVAVLNVRDTLVPHFLRDVNYATLIQPSPWGWWRDWFFLLYQVNLLFLFGSVAWLVILVTLVQSGRTASAAVRAAWITVICATILLGVTVHGGRDIWGLAHICLQPLGLLGLAWLGARWETLGPLWRRLVIAGAALDFAFGVALQFGAQSLLLDLWLAPRRSATDTLQSYSVFAGENWKAKLRHKLSFFGDAFAAHEMLILLLLCAVMLFALVRVHRQRRAA